MSEPLILGTGEVDDHPLGQWWAVGVMTLGGAADILACASVVGRGGGALYLGFVLFYVGILALLGLVFAIDAIRKALQPTLEPVKT